MNKFFKLTVSVLKSASFGETELSLNLLKAFPAVKDANYI